MEICWFNLELRTMVRVCNGWETWLKMGMPRLIGNLMKKHGFDETQRIPHDLWSSEKVMIFSIRKNRRVRNLDPKHPMAVLWQDGFCEDIGYQAIRSRVPRRPGSRCSGSNFNMLVTKSEFALDSFNIIEAEIPSNPFQSLPPGVSHWAQPARCVAA